MPDRQRDRAVHRLFEAALEIDESRRAAFLAENCADDPSLRLEVEDLLSSLLAADTRNVLPGLGQDARPPIARSGSLDPQRATGRRVLAGRYQLSSLIGQGGMGLVFRAHDLDRKVDIAIKTLHRLDGRGLYSFKNEFRSLADIGHPNLVRLGELVRDGEHWFFTMELIEGDDLLTHVALPGSEPRFHEGKLRDALLQLCSGIEALHLAGKVHRDIKPRNVLVARDGRVVLLDFGLVADALASGRTEEGWIVGTPAYMSPEQAAQRPVGPASDWYSVGAMLYEMLTGQPAFAGTSLEILERKQLGPPPPPRSVVPAIPPDLDQLCMDLLALEPAARLRGPEVRSRLTAGSHGMVNSAQVQGMAGPVAGTSALVGRTRELAVLAAALVSAGREAVAVLVRGESGVGKSALVRAFASSLDQTTSPPLVLAGRCYERESMPYKALDGVVDALSRHLMRLSGVEASRLLPRERETASLLRIFPALGRVPALAGIEMLNEVPDAHTLRRQAFTGLRELLGRLAERQRVVVVIDDLQWADADSEVLLEELLRSPGAPRLLLVATSRGQTVRKLPGVVREIALGGLAMEEARLLAEQMGARGEAALAAATEAKGHPLFIQELATRTAEGGHHQLDEVLWARIAALEPGAREVLDFVALAEIPLPQRHIAAASLSTTGAFDSRIGELRQSRLICTVGVGDQAVVECYHDRVRETVLAHLDGGARRSLHRRLARALEDAGVGERQPDLLVRHLELGGEPGRAAEHAVLAAQRAEGALAFEQAADLYRAALRMGSQNPEKTRQLQCALGQCLTNAGRGREAAHAFRSAAVDAPADDALEWRRRAAEQLLISGHMAEGMNALSEVVSAVGIPLRKTPVGVMLSLLWQRVRVRLRGLRIRQREPAEISRAELARVDICWSAAMGLSMIDPIRGAEFQARHLLLALRAGDPARIAHSLALEACHLTSIASRSTSRALRAQALANELARRIDQPYSLGAVALSQGATSYLCGRWREGTEHLDRASTIFRERCTGVAWEVDTAHLFGVFSLWFRGEIAELSRRVRHLSDEAERRGDFYATIALKTSLCNVTWLADDDVDEARRQLAEARKGWAVEGFQIQNYYLLLAEAMLLLYAGQGSAAFELMDRSWGPLQKSLLLRVQIVEAPMVHLRAAAALATAQAHPAGSRERAAMVNIARQDARRLARRNIIGYGAISQLVNAAVHATLGDRAQALAELKRAIAGFEMAEMALYAAAAKHRLGELLASERGRAHIAEARAFMAQQKVRNPTAMLEVLAPGFSRS